MSPPKTMKAMVLTGHGDLDAYEWHEDWPTPQPGPQQVLIKVGACGLNNTDINTRIGWYSKGDGDSDDATWGGGALTFPRIQGADVTGRIVAVGAEVDAGRIGARVLVDPCFRVWNGAPVASAVRWCASIMARIQCTSPVRSQ